MLNIQGRLLDLSIPSIMGVLNVTPDSFYDGGRYTGEKAILEQTEKMLSEGATFIDVGAYSSRPGAKDIPLDEELKRGVSAVKLVIEKFPGTIISIDTFRSAVASAAVQEGASLVNDISGGELDSEMFETVARLRVPYILMHMRGTPQNMSKLSVYDNLVKEVVDYFHAKIHRLHQLGITDIIVDPGFGFAKTIEQNFELLNHLEYLHILGKPVLTGLSRKSMIWKTLEVEPEKALNGTTALNTIALMKGVNILRVHDVKEAMESVKLVSRTKSVTHV
ncbi:MAG: dihydropteroate synthase [Marivirga sp.]|nr:dihydropteroate synthase [Marivirga sp.]